MLINHHYTEVGKYPNDVLSELGAQENVVYSEPCIGELGIVHV